MEKLSVNQVVYQYKTKNEMGFIYEEINDLLSKFFPNINREKFDNSLRGVTCMGDENGNAIIYHVDIERAIISALRGSETSGIYWD
jgi:hypothetical protein